MGPHGSTRVASVVPQIYKKVELIVKTKYNNLIQKVIRSTTTTHMNAQNEIHLFLLVSQGQSEVRFNPVCTKKNADSYKSSRFV